MRTRLLWLATPALFLAAVVTAATNACSRSNTQSVTSTRVDQLFGEWNRPDSPGCSVGVSRNGAVAYEHGYGMANLEQGVPITPASVLGAASISKQFTAMSILLLAEHGQLSLDDEVSKVIPEWTDRENHITIRHLLTHTSGLRDGFVLLGWATPSAVDTNDAIASMLARQRSLNFAPGTEFQYNNGGYNLLGSIVKRVSGQSLRAFTDANIFIPLGMTSTHFRDDPAMILPNRALGYSQDTTGLHQVSAEGEGRGFPVGNGGLYTTAGDLLRWEQNLADPRVGTPALVAAMQTPAVLTSGDKSPYGLGLFIGEYRGLRTVFHGGSDRGIATFGVRYPDQGLAIAVLCNLGTIPAEPLAQRVAEIYLSDVLAGQTANSAVAKIPPVSPSADDFSAKVGLYRDPVKPLEVIRIFVRDGRLIGRNLYSDDTDFELTPVDANRFLWSGSTIVLEFVPAAAGRVQEWHVTNDGQQLAALQLTTFVPSIIELRSFVGDYRSPEIDVTYSVAARGSSLVVQPSGMADIPLLPVSKDAFAGDIVGTVEFERDARGTVRGFTVNRYFARGVRFDRVRRAG